MVCFLLKQVRFFMTSPALPQLTWARHPGRRVNGVLPYFAEIVNSAEPGHLLDLAVSSKG
jgi:hypothetical protein